VKKLIILMMALIMPAVTEAAQPNEQKKPTCAQQTRFPALIDKSLPACTREEMDKYWQEEQERINQLKACEATPAYLLYAAQEAVIENIETQQNLKQSVARQKQLTKMSGVRNLSEEREIAVEQLDAREALKELWTDYKSAGGKAASPQAVKHKIEDPCDSFRPES
jgi:alkyl sulfatase BDS1-like metallo-beta-lactamase superfamily hydrolase